MIKSTFIDRGIPVIIREYDAFTKNIDMESVRNFLYSVANACYDRNIVPILQDSPDGFYDRKKCVMADPVIKNILNNEKDKYL